MLIKIGSSKYLDGGRIIGIFDMDTATVCAASRVFLSRAQKEGRVSLADEDIPKSFVLYLDGGEHKICFSPLSVSALKGRLEENYEAISKN